MTTVEIAWNEWWAVPVPRRVPLLPTVRTYEVDEAVVQRWEAAAVEFHAACIALAEATDQDLGPRGLGWDGDVPKENQ